MRDILFRGQRVDTKEWVEGSLVNNLWLTSATGEAICEIIMPVNEADCWEDQDSAGNIFKVIPETVGQLLFTNKQGKFFEGDRVRYIIDEDGDIYKKCETFFEGYLQLNSKGIRIVKPVQNSFTAVYLSERTMIGELNLNCIHLFDNIFQHPELLSPSINK